MEFRERRVLTRLDAPSAEKVVTVTDPCPYRAAAKTQSPSAPREPWTLLLHSTLNLHYFLILTFFF